jgi:hypothetical protein
MEPGASVAPVHTVRFGRGASMVRPQPVLMM